ncbi:hypothetical protein D3C84_990190 [compost metagenome]
MIDGRCAAYLETDLEQPLGAFQGLCFEAGGLIVDKVVRDIKRRLSGPGQLLGQVLRALDAEVPVNHAEHQDHGLPVAGRHGNIDRRWQGLQLGDADGCLWLARRCPGAFQPASEPMRQLAFLVCGER